METKPSAVCGEGGVSGGLSSAVCNMGCLQMSCAEVLEVDCGLLRRQCLRVEVTSVENENVMPGGVNVVSGVCGLRSSSSGLARTKPSPSPCDEGVEATDRVS